MRVQGRLFLALAVALAVGACAPAATTNGAPGEAGTRPSATRFSNQATLQIAQAQTAEGEEARQLYDQALQASLQGIESAPGNPIHYYLAGSAYAGIGDFDQADAMWARAEEIYPGYRADVEIAREQAWAAAFNDGVNAYNEGNVEEALRMWERANEIFEGRSEAYFNIAAIHTQQQQYDRAIEAFRSAAQALERTPQRELTPEELEERAQSRVQALQNLGQMQLFTEQFGEAEATFRRLVELHPDDVAAQSSLAVALARQGKRDEAMGTYQTLLATPGLSADDMMAVGVGLFQAQEYAQAGEAFRRITDMAPDSRDAWYNYLNALYAQDRFADLIPVAERLLQIDPLNENAHLILARSHREQRQNQRALQVLQQNESHPVHLDNLQLRQEGGRASVRGTVSGNQARPGTPVRLEFTFMGATAPLGTQIVTVNAPAGEQTAQFEASITTDQPVTGYRYRVVQ